MLPDRRCVQLVVTQLVAALTRPSPAQPRGAGGGVGGVGGVCGWGVNKPMHNLWPSLLLFVIRL